MLVADLEHLEAVDKLHAIKGCESYQSKFSINLADDRLVIRDQGNQIYRTFFPLPIAFSIQDIPGTITSGSSQSPDGSVKSSYVVLAGQGTQNNQKFSVLFSSSSAVLSF